MSKLKNNVVYMKASNRMKNKLNESLNSFEKFGDYEEIYPMCRNCEDYCGAIHDYKYCYDMPCFCFYLGYKGGGE